MSAVTQVSGFDDCIRTELPLYIEHPLHDVRRTPVRVVGQRKRWALTRSAPVAATASLEPPGIAQIRIGSFGIGGELRAATDIAGQVEPRFDDVLNVVHAQAGPHGPGFRRAVR